MRKKRWFRDDEFEAYVRSRDVAYGPSGEHGFMKRGGMGSQLDFFPVGWDRDAGNAAPAPRLPSRTAASSATSPSAENAGEPT